MRLNFAYILVGVQIFGNEIVIAKISPQFIINNEWAIRVNDISLNQKLCEWLFSRMILYRMVVVCWFTQIILIRENCPAM